MPAAAASPFLPARSFFLNPDLLLGLLLVDALRVNRVIRSPGEYMQPASDAVSEVARNLDPKFLKEGERVMVGFSGPFGFHRVTPRDLMSSFIGTMVCVEGIVTKCIDSLCLSGKKQLHFRCHVSSSNHTACWVHLVLVVLNCRQDLLNKFQLNSSIFLAVEYIFGKGKLQNRMGRNCPC